MTVSGERGLRLGRMGDGSDNGWIILALLAGVVAFTGGASRFDAIQIIPLRSLAAIFFVSSLFYLSKKKLKDERDLLAMLACLLLIVLLQLVPLPPWLWQNLPGRSDILQLDSVLGLEETWRPITMAPMRSWNVLGGLIVPAAGFSLAIAMRAQSLTLLRIVAGLGVLNASVGLIQIASGASSVLYLYERTNLGSPVGIFANENHAAIFAACSMLVIALLGLRVGKGRNAALERLVYPPAFFLVLFVSLAGGSRAGFVATIGAILASIAMLVLSPRLHKGRASESATRRWLNQYPRMVLAIPVIVVALTAIAFVALDRTPAFRDFLAKDSLEDLRWSFWPVMIDILENHWVLGAGFGSFEQVYKMYEPSALLMPRYVYQAHNDWVQLIIEGGVFAGLLLIGLLAWVTKAVVTMSLHPLKRGEAIFG